VIESATIALKAYVVPMTSTRAFRIGLLIFLLFVGLVVFAALVKPLAALLAQASLDRLRHGAVIPGVPLAALLLSEIPLRDGIRHRTLLYPLLGPVSRTMIAVVRSVATAMLVALAMTTLWVLVRLVQGKMDEPSAGQLIAIWAGSGAFVGLFGFIHLVSRRGLLVGLAYYGLFDDPVGRLPFALRNVSLSYHLRVLSHQLQEIDLPIELSPPHSSPVFSSFFLIASAVVLMAVTAVLFKRKQLGELC
jgi:hypothetical protein